jgi:hypothetical protein
MRSDWASDVHAAFYGLLRNFLHSEFDKAVVDENASAGFHVLSKMGIGDWNIQDRGDGFLRRAVNDKPNDLAGSRFYRTPGEISHADARSLQILNNGHRSAMPFGRLAYGFNGARVRFMRAMRKIKTSRIHAAYNQAVK